MCRGDVGVKMRASILELVCRGWNYPWESFFQMIAEESEIPSRGFLYIPTLAAKLKVECPKETLIIDAVKKKGFPCAKTHFKENSLRTTMSEKELLKVLRQIAGR